MEKQQLSPREIAYLDELALDINANGGCDHDSFESAAHAAHGRRQAFAKEAISANTKRARMARKAVKTAVWIALNARAAKVRVTMQAKNSAEKLFLQCDLIDQS